MTWKKEKHWIDKGCICDFWVYSQSFDVFNNTVQKSFNFKKITPAIALLSVLVTKRSHSLIAKTNIYFSLKKTMSLPMQIDVFDNPHFSICWKSFKEK